MFGSRPPKATRDGKKITFIMNRKEIEIDIEKRREYGKTKAR